MKYQKSKVLVESTEDYLERILVLNQQGNNNVHAIDIVHIMGLSKPSVSIAIKKLEAKGLVNVDSGIIRLTNEGYAIATKILDRHHHISQYLVEIGVSKENAELDACMLEHGLTEETYQALLKELKAKLAQKEKE